MRRILSTTVLSLGLTTAACGGTTGIGLDFEPNQGAANALMVDANLTVDRLEIQLREIKVLADSDDGTNAKAKGEFLVDVLDADGSRVPALELEPGLYKKVEFKMAKPDGGQGIDGTEASLWLEGTKDDVAFRYLGENHEKITLRNVDGIQLEDGAAEEFIVDLQVASWLTGVDFSALELTNDVAVIDKSGANKDAYDTIDDNIKAAIKAIRKP
ncbi:hypothetical protein L6R52_10090 [Myxococcota bacterium]|nr:hypothetical protein [Myxococcota bacterium]